MNQVETKTKFTDKLKKVFKRLYGKPMDIYEECLLDALPDELTEFISHSADAADKICDLLDLFRQRMAPDITQSEVADLSDWLQTQGTKYSARLMLLIRGVNIIMAAIADLRLKLLP